MQHVPEESIHLTGESWKLKVIGFADDTTPIGRYDPSNPERDELKTTQIFADQLQQVHDGKTEYLVARTTNSKANSTIPEKQRQANVRLLGGWIDADGGTKRDTAERLKAASKN